MTTLKGSGQVATENTPLVTRTPSPAIPWNSSFVSLAPEEDSKVYSNDSTEFFPVIIDELEKVNKFYIGKVAELRIVLEGITRSRSNSYLTHHTGSSDVSNLAKLRDIYLELKALHAYCELNKTGFYKIIKKYDKTLGEDTLKDWKRTIDDQQFSISTEPLRLIDIVTDLVSRNKLMEWEIFASEQKYKSDDEIFPSVKPHSVLISVLLFLLSLAFPIVTPHDVAANRCFSLLVLAVSLWVTEAVPYFATALIIPALVTFLRVLKDPKDPTKAMSPEESSAFVLDHIFNHTTMLLLGGYTISTAFARCQLELRVASFLQTRLGDRPLIFILAIMFLGLFLSMWINNHTAPILLATIILPIVRDLPTDSR